MVSLAEELDIDDVAAIGHLVALWSWAIDNAPSGVLPQSDRQIATGAMWKGNATKFREALFFAGFIDDDYNGRRTLHDWEEWAGALIRKRNADRERMKELREKQQSGR
jgi:hypothetical protein